MHPIFSQKEIKIKNEKVKVKVKKKKETNPPTPITFKNAKQTTYLFPTPV